MQIMPNGTLGSAYVDVAKALYRVRGQRDGSVAFIVGFVKKFAHMHLSWVPFWEFYHHVG